MEHHPAEAGQAAAAAPVEYHVHIRALPVQGEQVYHTQRIPVVLLAQHIAVHAEDAHVARMQRVVIEVGDAAAVQHGF